MGISPVEAMNMTLAEFVVVQDGWAKAQDAGDRPEPPSVDDYIRMFGERS